MGLTKVCTDSRLAGLGTDIYHSMHVVLGNIVKLGMTIFAHIMFMCLHNFKAVNLPATSLLASLTYING